MSMRPRLLSLCTGTGALDMAVGAFYGADVVAVAETDPGACKLLALRAPEIPNLGDLTQLDWATVPECDILTAGFPCQPVSHAGKRKGTADERWIWGDIAEGLRQLRPAVAVFENVRGLLTANGGHAFARVLHDIHSVGIYECRWGAVRAADAGAAHRRERIFILCVAADTRGERHGGGQDGGEVGLLDGRDESQTRQQQRARQVAVNRGAEAVTDTADLGHQRPRTPRRRRDGSTNGGDTAVADAAGAERRAEEHETVGAAVGSAAELGERHSEAAADADDGRLEGIRAEHRLEEAAGEPPPVDRFGPYGPAVERWERIVGRRAPDPTDERGLNPWFVEWMMGFETGFVCSAGLSRTDELRLLGNSVVAQQALLALELLHE